MRKWFSGSHHKQAPKIAKRFIAGTVVRRLSKISKPIKVGTAVQSGNSRHDTVHSTSVCSLPFSSLPPHKVCPDTECIAYDSQKTYKLLVFDLETTGLARDAEICQLAAVGSKVDDPLWMKYILPNSYINPSASVVNGLTVAVRGKERRLLKDGSPVDTVSCEEATSSFLAFLKAQAATASNTILVGHNAALFDVPIFLNSLHRYGITANELEEQGIGFADSRLLIRSLKRTGHPSLSCSRESLGSVYQCLFGEDFQRHDAVNDCLALRRVLFMSPLDITLEQILAHSFTAASAWRRNEFYNDKNKLLPAKKNRPWRWN